MKAPPIISLAACEWFAWVRAKQGKTKWHQGLESRGVQGPETEIRETASNNKRESRGKKEGKEEA